MPTLANRFCADSHATLHDSLYAGYVQTHGTDDTLEVRFADFSFASSLAGGPWLPVTLRAYSQLSPTVDVNKLAQAYRANRDLEALLAVIFPEAEDEPECPTCGARTGEAHRLYCDADKPAPASFDIRTAPGLTFDATKRMVLESWARSAATMAQTLAPVADADVLPADVVDALRDYDFAGLASALRAVMDGDGLLHLPAVTR